MSSYRIWRLAVRNLQHRRTALTNVGTRIVVSILPQRLTLPCRKLQGSLVHGGRLLSQRHIATKKQPPFNYLRKAANEQLQNVEASNRLLAQYLGVIYYRFRLSKPIRRSGMAVYAPISTARLPTNTTAHRHPVHRWFNCCSISGAWHPLRGRSLCLLGRVAIPAGGGGLLVGGRLLGAGGIRRLEHPRVVHVQGVQRVSHRGNLPRGKRRRVPLVRAGCPTGRQRTRPPS